MENVSTMESKRTSFFGWWAFFERGQSEHMAGSVGVVGGIFSRTSSRNFTRLSALRLSHCEPFGATRITRRSQVKLPSPIFAKTHDVSRVDAKSFFSLCNFQSHDQEIVDYDNDCFYRSLFITTFIFSVLIVLNYFILLILINNSFYYRAHIIRRHFVNSPVNSN